MLKTATCSVLRKTINLNTFSPSIRTWNYARNISSHRFTTLRQNKKLTTSYVWGPNEIPLLQLTLGQLLQKAADSYGDETSVVFVHQNVRKTFHQLLQEVDQVAAGLLSLGLNPGDRLGIWGPNSYEWLLTQWAAARAGLILVNINPAYRANELRHALNKGGVKGLVLADKLRNESLQETLNKTLNEEGAKVPSLEKVIVISNRSVVPNALLWSDLVDRATPSLVSQIHNLQRRIQFNDPVSIQFTSGTTGSPKGATLSHHSLANSAYVNAFRLGYREQSHRLCLPLPLFHGFACAGVMTGAAHGACLVFPSATYNGIEAVKAIEQERCTILYGTPTMLVDILNLPTLKQHDTSSWSMVLVGGAPCPLELAKSINKELNVKHIMIGYGMTETSAAGFMARKTDSLETNCATVGYVADHFEIKIVDPVSREIVPINTPGEICMRGYGVMLGYWNEPEKTAETITKDGWILTGDLGVLTGDGHGKIVGRIKDMVIRGGENIYPREIEELLHTHPDIQEAQVIGVPDARLGEEVCAWIRRKPQSQVSEEELKNFCKEKIAYFKVPRYWLFKESFPLTMTGKVQKFVMRDLTVKELGL